MPNIKAIRKGRTAVFSEKVWATGQPQRYGWVEIGAPLQDKKTLPTEILEFAEIRKGKRNEPLREDATTREVVEEKPTIGEIIRESADVVKEVPDVIREGKEFKKKPSIEQGAKLAKEVGDVVKEVKEVKELIEKRKEAKGQKKSAKAEKKVIRKTRKNDNSK